MKRKQYCVKVPSFCGSILIRNIKSVAINLNDVVTMKTAEIQTLFGRYRMWPVPGRMLLVSLLQWCCLGNRFCGIPPKLGRGGLA